MAVPTRILRLLQVLIRTAELALRADAGYHDQHATLRLPRNANHLPQILDMVENRLL